MMEETARLETSAWQAAPAASARPLFAIGDVHGCHGLLRLCHAHLASAPRPGALVVHLGDLIDRGPEGAAALRAAAGFALPGAECVLLPGNHEQMLLAFLDACADEAPATVREDAFDLWFHQGGARLCEELGLEEMDDLAALAAALEAALAPALARLRRAPAGVRDGAWLFVHAGIPWRPMGFMDPAAVPGFAWYDRARGLAGIRQAAHPLWVREPFLGHEEPWPGGAIVVHGHTPAQAGPESRANRIGIDTGAVFTGRLTMLEIDGARMRFHTASAA